MFRTKHLQFRLMTQFSACEITWYRSKALTWLHEQWLIHSFIHFLYLSSNCSLITITIIVFILPILIDLIDLYLVVLKAFAEISSSSPGQEVSLSHGRSRSLPHHHIRLSSVIFEPIQMKETLKCFVIPHCTITFVFVHQFIHLDLRQQTVPFCMHWDLSHSNCIRSNALVFIQGAGRNLVVLKYICNVYWLAKESEICYWENHYLTVALDWRTYNTYILYFHHHLDSLFLKP